MYSLIQSAPQVLQALMYRSEKTYLAVEGENMCLSYAELFHTYHNLMIIPHNIMNTNLWCNLYRPSKNKRPLCHFLIFFIEVVLTLRKAKKGV